MISVIVPCFNEEEAIPLFFAEMEKTKKKIAHDFEYIFIKRLLYTLDCKRLREI